MEKRTAASQALKRQRPGSFTAVNGNSAPTVQGRQFNPVHEFVVQYGHWKSLNNSQTSNTEYFFEAEDMYEHAPAVSSSRSVYLRDKLIKDDSRPTLNDFVL